MAQRPNIILIVTDQHRADHLACYGNPLVRTPHIDSLAAQGTRFDRFYVASPVCMANRATLMTGRMPSLHGVRHNGIPLSRDHVTFVELLAAAGYHTALIGKSHLQNFTGAPPPPGPAPPDGLTPPPETLREADRRQRRGPDYDIENQRLWDDPEHDVRPPFYGFREARICTGHGDQVGGDYRRWLRSKGADVARLAGPENALPDQRRIAPQAWRTRTPEDLYPTRYVEELTRACLEERAREKDPFFLQVSFPDPHHPFTPPGRYWDMYDPADIVLPASFGTSALAPVQWLRAALERGEAVRDLPTVPFAVADEEARVIIALTYGMITMVDDAVGRLLLALDDVGLARNTIVMFTTDHGDYMGDHGIMLKYLLHFQGLIRVPFLCRLPGGTASVRSDLAGTIDLPATILALAGLAPFAGMQGRDLFDPAFSPPDGMLVEEDALFPMFGAAGTERVRSFVTGRWRLTHHQQVGGPDTVWWELYDLDEDPHELENLWNTEKGREVADGLVRSMLARSIALQDMSPLPTGRA
jgi:arylsulfatase A-like enzyme